MSGASAKPSEKEVSLEDRETGLSLKIKTSEARLSAGEQKV